MKKDASLIVAYGMFCYVLGFGVALIADHIGW